LLDHQTAGKLLSMLAFVLALLLAAPFQAATPAPRPADPLPADWMPVPADELLLVTLDDGGTVTIRLAARYAPAHVANVRRLTAARWWDAGASVYRVQDNYVAQWGDATEKKRLPATVVAHPAAEYEHAGPTAVTRLSRRDPYAEWSGYTRDGWAVAGSGKAEWLPHCYASVGVARDLAPSTGSGAELYAVIGHAPRHLDRNIAIIGRVVDGIERLSTLPRGTGNLGFYTDPAQRVAIRSVRLASELPAGQRPQFEYRRPDNQRFSAWIGGRENREPPFFTVPAGGADICNAQPPVRRVP
jgi:peptidylprolyl isomerase